MLIICHIYIYNKPLSMDFKTRQNLKKLICESLIESDINLLFNYHNPKKDKIQRSKNSFGWNVTDKKYGDTIIDSLVHISMEEKGVSEKSFSAVDNIVNDVKTNVLSDKNILNIIFKGYMDNLRPNYVAEKIYNTLLIKERVESDKSSGAIINVYPIPKNEKTYYNLIKHYLKQGYEWDKAARSNDFAWKIYSNNYNSIIRYFLIAVQYPDDYSMQKKVLYHCYENESIHFISRLENEYNVKHNFLNVIGGQKQNYIEDITSLQDLKKYIDHIDIIDDKYFSVNFIDGSMIRPLKLSTTQSPGDNYNGRLVWGFAQIFLKIIKHSKKFKEYDYSDVKNLMLSVKEKRSELLTEKKKSHYEVLEKNKIPLTDEERKEVFKKDAVWHYGFSKDPNTGRRVKKVSAVWKSKDKEGNIVYITNTHRAFATASTLKGAIKKYHDNIKGTA